ncbi:MAG: uroporphyrinogen decarboxylase, partial [Chloroflexota bacterium]|nr:uroporphyrinogen decarboxylase [Chloroflexota bacterium]
MELFEDAICLRTPERVPIAVQAGFYSALYAGITPYEAMYNYKKAGDAARKFNADFQTDTLTGAGQGPARAFDILDYKLYRWPGHGLDESAPFQCIESDYMKAGEYEALMDDPSGYFMRSYLPRVFGALEPLQQLNPPTDLLELPMLGPWLRVLARPEVREAFAKLLAAGEAAEEWATACRAVNQEIVAEHGLPSGRGGFTKAPFDTLGDTLRGTRAMMADRFRQPDRVRQAIERWIPLAIEMGVRNSNQSKHPLISIPLHKGADGFMSDEDFRKFYWPSLKAVLLGLINEGVVPCLFAEGGYNDRLDVIADS